MDEIILKVRRTGQYKYVINGDCADSISICEIMEITGGELPGLKYEPACLPFAFGASEPELPVGPRTKVHKVGNFIGTDAVEELEEMGVKVEWIKK